MFNEVEFKVNMYCGCFMKPSQDGLQNKGYDAIETYMVDTL